MQLDINGTKHTISNEAMIGLLKFFELSAKEAYNKLTPNYQIIADQGARAMLYDLEKKSIKAGRSKEEAKTFRPENGQQPSEKMLQTVLGNSKPFLDKVTISLSTSDHIVHNIEIHYSDETV